MNVDTIEISGELYEYDNSTNTVLKSDYGVFLFTRRDGDDKFHGRISPHMVDFLTGESLVQEEMTIEAYSNEDNLFVPVYEATGMEPNRVFVIDGDVAIKFGGINQTVPEKIKSDAESERFVEVYTAQLTESLPYSRELVSRNVVVDVFEEYTVERVIVV